MHLIALHTLWAPASTPRAQNGNQQTQAPQAAAGRAPV